MERRAFLTAFAGTLGSSLAQAATWDRGREIRHGELKPWKAGATPVLSLQDAQGREHGLAALRGKLVLVNFWATWCDPCRDEMPSLVQLKQQMGDGIEILAVNLGESEQKAEAFIKTVMPSAAKGGAGMTVLYDRDLSVARRWKATLAPATFVIAPGWRIAYSLIGEADWSSPAMVKTLRALQAKR